MKKTYIKDIHFTARRKKNSAFNLFCWIRRKRAYKDIVFLDIVDSTGQAQAVAQKKDVSEDTFKILKTIPAESCVELSCNKSFDCVKKKEGIFVYDCSVIGRWKLNLQPLPRSDFDIFSSKNANYLLRNRHLYIRNPKLIAMLKFRHQTMHAVREWFSREEFTEITAPILTKLPLYDDGSAISVQVGKNNVFLTQCVGFYLESAAAALEKVYNIGPSFRGEESRSKRHLIEYWHTKAEVAFANLEEGQKMVEDLLTHIVHSIKNNSQVSSAMNIKSAKEILNKPYPKISYREALKLLNKSGCKIKFGESISNSEEEILSKRFNAPFWLVGIPRAVEPFPYVINAKDEQVTRVSDLIAPRGYGELLGVAEKIFEINELKARMKEKGKLNNKNYNWVQELRNSGFFPHVGFGMGVERLMRYLLGQKHVRDMIPFPRLFRRQIYP